MRKGDKTTEGKNPRKTAEWFWLRMEAIMRDDYECQECGVLGGRKGDAQLQAHHIIPVSEGGENDPDNLLTLCRQCHLYEFHDWKHAKRGSVEVVDEQTTLTESDEDTDSDDPTPPDGVPNKAYVTVKNPHPGCEYYYWQWRDGDSWKNEYIGPVDDVEFRRID